MDAGAKLQPLRILIVPGSLNQSSMTHALCDHIRNMLTEVGAQPTYWDLRTSPLPLADPQYHHEPLRNPSEVVRNFITAVAMADGLVLGSPVYHNGPSGLLKNALDHLAATALSWKAVGLVGNGGGRTTQAVDQLRLHIRGLGGHAIPTQICTSKEDFIENNDCHEGLAVSNPAIVRRSVRFIEELTALARVIPFGRKISAIKAS